MRLKEEYRTETTIEKSRFIACLSPCKDEEEARQYIASIRREFPDATHVCSAYRIGPLAHSSDNGEPAGTAGRPMLERLIHADLDQVCACVVRYFGGIKLGTGGLVRAYGGIVQKAIGEAPMASEQTVALYTVSYPYELSGSFAAWLRTNSEILDTDYSDTVNVLVSVTDPAFVNNAQAASKGKAQVTFLRNETRLIPIH